MRFLLHFFFFNDTATTEIYTLSLHDALPISPPADGRDHSGRTAPAGSRNHLSREVAPRTRAMEDGGMERLSARSSITARLARPSSGAAVTRTRSVPACQPTIALARALGCTRTWSSPSRVGRLGILGVRLEVLLEQSVVHLHGGAQALRELAPHALEGLDLRVQVALRLARGIDDPVGLRLGLADDDARLAARALLHLFHEPLRRHERLLEHLLALLQAPGALLERLELLLEQRVLLEQGLVIRGEVLQEGVDLLGVEAAEHLHGELLLADIHRCDAHSRLLYFR